MDADLVGINRDEMGATPVEDRDVLQDIAGQDKINTISASIISHEVFVSTLPYLCVQPLIRGYTHDTIATSWLHPRADEQTLPVSRVEKAD